MERGAERVSIEVKSCPSVERLAIIKSFPIPRVFATERESTAAVPVTKRFSKASSLKNPDAVAELVCHCLASSSKFLSVSASARRASISSIVIPE